MKRRNGRRRRTHVRTRRVKFTEKKKKKKRWNWNVFIAMIYFPSWIFSGNFFRYIHIYVSVLPSSIRRFPFRYCYLFPFRHLVTQLRDISKPSHGTDTQCEFAFDAILISFIRCIKWLMPQIVLILNLAPSPLSIPIVATNCANIAQLNALQSLRH